MRKFLIVVIIALASAGASYAQTLKNMLETLDGVVSIQEITQENKIFDEKYIITFEQPLDWDGASDLYFTQRVEIGFKGFDKINIFNVGGYNLQDKNFSSDDRVDLAKIFDANYIAPEYRYFGKSAPAGLSVNDTNLWEYLTDYNASSDFHNIITQLKQILTGKFIFTGASKGGQATNVHAYYYPSDADIYVSYVAPFCNGQEDMRMIDAINNNIGTERYGSEQAKKYRDLMLDFQVELIREREFLQPKLMANRITSFDVSLRPEYNISKDYEIYYALDFVEEIWQYEQNFVSVDYILNMPRENSNDRQIYLNTMLEFMKADDGDNSIADFFPYEVQAHKENGKDGYKFKYLREKLNKAGLNLTINENEESGLYSRMIFTPEQRKIFTFNPDLRNKIIDWTQNNTSNVIMLHGSSDPWYYGRLEEADNGRNIYLFVDDTQAHGLNISKMPENLRIQVMNLLNDWLYNESDNNYALSKSNSGCNSGLSSILLAVVLLGMCKRGIFRLKIFSMTS
ncbi:MAG: hypothetical protein IJS99_07540 [Synergistaceae bacterium]|nr:hypothetical protein [Synergistaceae bacterium]